MGQRRLVRRRWLMAFRTLFRGAQARYRLRVGSRVRCGAWWRLDKVRRQPGIKGAPVFVQRGFVLGSKTVLIVDHGDDAFLVLLCCVHYIENAARSITA